MEMFNFAEEKLHFCAHETQKEKIEIRVLCMYEYYL